MGETEELDVTINAEALGKPGDDVRRCLRIRTNDPENAILYVDLIVHIEAGPTIAEATATPTIGEPPLKVAFNAVTEPGATDIIDTWWDFGDGSDLVHEADVYKRQYLDPVGQAFPSAAWPTTAMMTPFTSAVGTRTSSTRSKANRGTRPVR